jgi:hypothetical protein
MLSEATIQRIEHLKLQGFTPEQASEMQKVSIWEVLKVYNQDKVFVYEKKQRKHCRYV